MVKRKYTADNIKHFLEELGFEWLDKTIYDSQACKYRKFKCEDYKRHSLIFYLSAVNGNKFNALCEISETTFIISIGNQKLDDSLNWQDYLNSLNAKVLP